MASIRERTSMAGETTYAVLYRRGKRQSSITFAKRKDAQEFKTLIDVLGPDRALKAVADDSPDDRMTVGELAARFLAWKERDVTPRTMGDYRRDVANWILPWFGDHVAELVDESDVQQWVDHMAERLSPKSVADRHMLLHAMFKFGKARTRRLVSHNPCEETELPRRSPKPPKGTTVIEWRAMIRAAEQRGNADAADLLLFLGSIGWRFSEATALCVDAVEDDGANVWVDVVRVFRLVDNRQILVEDAAKSYAGFRRTRLPAEAAAMVRRRIVGKGPRDYVFTNSRGNHWNQNTFLRNTWPTILSAAQVGSEARRPTPHWLRHMAVAVMAAAGVPMHEIQRIIGHEDVKTTNSVYGGMISTINNSALENMDRILAGRLARGDVVVAGEVIGELG